MVRINLLIVLQVFGPPFVSLPYLQLVAHLYILFMYWLEVVRLFGFGEGRRHVNLRLVLVQGGRLLEANRRRHNLIWLILILFRFLLNTVIILIWHVVLLYWHFSSCFCRLRGNISVLLILRNLRQTPLCFSEQPLIVHGREVGFIF